MSDLAERDLMDRLAHRARIILAVSMAGLLVMACVTLFRHDDKGAGLGGGHVMPEKAAGAKADRPPTTAFRADFLDWLVLATAAVSLALSAFLPRLYVTRSRRRIASGNWLSQSRRWVGEDGRLDQLLEHEAIRTDRGQLSYVCATQFILGGGLLFPALFVTEAAYLIAKSPIALIVGVLLVGMYVAWFPTLSRLRRQVGRQERLLIAERNAAGL